MPTGSRRRSASLSPHRCIALGALLWGSTSASAKSDINTFRVTPSTTEAGAHPDVYTSVRVGNRITGEKLPCDCADPKDITIHTPGGVIANQSVVPTCSGAELILLECATDTQVGDVALVTGIFPPILMPIHRTVEQGGQAALFGFVVPILGNPTYISITARTGSDYGLDFTTQGISHVLPVEGFDTIFWGVPAAERHDLLRFGRGETYIFCFSEPEVDLVNDTLGNACPAQVQGQENGTEFSRPKVPVTTSIPVRPYTQNPTTCVGPLTASVDDLSYDREITHAEAEWPETTGCDQLSFSPSLAANPTTTATDTASGLEVDLKYPSRGPPTPVSIGDEAEHVSMPQGFTFNSNAADGKVACTDAEADSAPPNAAECPEFSKIGRLEIDSSALPGPSTGTSTWESRSRAIGTAGALTADGFATHVKLPGTVTPDPPDGQLTICFTDLPQSPLTAQHALLRLRARHAGDPDEVRHLSGRIHLHSLEQEHLATDLDPVLHHQHRAEGRAVPDGARPFAPGFEAARPATRRGPIRPLPSISRARTATRTWPASRLPRRPASRPLSAASRIARRRRRPDPQLDVCGHLRAHRLRLPVATQIGSATAGAGAGTDRCTSRQGLPRRPLQGRAAQPPRGDPGGLGPLRSRQRRGQGGGPGRPGQRSGTTTSDPLPQILEGIPLGGRSIRVNFDRPNFAINPTNCEPLSVDATVSGDEGGVAHISDPYQVANCSTSRSSQSWR